MKLIFCLLCAALVSTAAAGQSKKLLIAHGLQATINHSAGSRTVQVLIPGVEIIELDLEQPVQPAYQIRTADYNYDGFRDFAFVAVNQASGTQGYEIFLYHPEDKSFEALDVPDGICGRFGNVRLSAGNRTLKSSCRSGGKSSTDIYKWSSPFSLELVSSKDNTAETLGEAAEEKAELKAEKAGQRKEIRDERLEQRKEKREEREDEDE